MKKLERDYGEILWTGKKCIMGMPISFTRYILTSSVLYTKVGFLNIKEDEIELYKIVDKTMKLSLGQRMVGANLHGHGDMGEDNLHSEDFDEMADM